jgi:hypothetical protein
MLVTDKNIYLDDKYKEKLDLMIKRISGKGTDDVLLPIDGNEGEGKTELAMATCYYIAYKTGRKYTMDNVFFDLEKCIKFIQTTKDQIIHFDEAVLGLLISQRWEKAQIQFTQLVMVARKKRHFIVLCIPKFHRLPSYVIEDRAIGLVHVYSDKGVHKGKFAYFNRNAKDKLCEYWKRKREKGYKKYYSFRGVFRLAGNRIFTPEEIKKYDEKKDEGILSIGQAKMYDREKKKLDHRNIIITGIRKKWGLNSTELSGLLKEWGVLLSPKQIREIAPLEQIANFPPVRTAG